MLVLSSTSIGLFSILERNPEFDNVSARLLYSSIDPAPKTMRDIERFLQ
jgi:hypothetical protein